MMKTDELKMIVGLLVTMSNTLKEVDDGIRQLIKAFELEIDRQELEQKLM